MEPARPDTDEIPAKPPAAKADRIDAQWRERSPGWGPNEHRNERELFSDILRDGENIESLLAGRYKAEFRGASEYNGIVVATDRRVIFRTQATSPKM